MDQLQRLQEVKSKDEKKEGIHNLNTNNTT